MVGSLIAANQQAITSGQPACRGWEKSLIYLSARHGGLAFPHHRPNRDEYGEEGMSDESTQTSNGALSGL
jgi:hypothetical protein